MESSFSTNRRSEFVFGNINITDDILNNTDVLIYVVDVNEKFIFANKKLADLFNKPADFIIGRTWYDFLPKEAADEHSKSDNTVVKTIKPITTKEVINQEDGLHTYLTTKHPLTDVNGKIIAITGYSTDITKEVLLEVKLEKQSKVLDNFFNMNIDLMCIADFNGYFKRLNPEWEKIFGFTLEELYSKPFIYFVHPDDIEATKDIFGELKNNKRASNFVNRYLTKSGKYKWIEWSSYPSDKLIFAVARDITERKDLEYSLIKAKEKAEEMNSLKTNFLLKMSQEIRNPLSTILGYSQIISEKSKENETVHASQTIYKEGTRLLNTLTLILELSKIEADNVSVQFSDIDISDLVKEISSLFESSVSQKNLTLTYKIADNIFIHSDTRMLTQIIYNLIDNSVKFTKKGNINISLREEKTENQDWVVLKIKDTGIGIHKEDINHIFKEFRQVSEGLFREYEGTGLGLTICKAYIKILKGTINVESKAKEGSCFTVRLPVEKYKKEEVNNLWDTKADKNKSLPKVLFIEDHYSIYDLVKVLLQKVVILEHADNADTALEKINEKVYPLILLDINLGSSKSGLYILEKLKKIDKYKNIPVIAVTAYARTEDRDTFLKAGCSHYITKPINRMELLNLVRKVLQKN